MTYFSLNDRKTDLYYSILFYSTIFICTFGLKYMCYREKPSSSELINIGGIYIGVLLFYGIVSPQQPIHVLQDDKHNDHITKI